MEELRIRLPQKQFGYELYRKGESVVSVHGDGTLHFWFNNEHHIIKPNEDMKLGKMNSIWVVYRTDPEGINVKAICETAELAEEAKIRLAAILTTSLSQFEISEIAFNAGHPFGILDQNSSFDVGGKWHLRPK
jgi:hypothetical protein